MRKVAAAGLLLCVTAVPTWGWGREGHRLTALVAEHYLTPETAAAVKDILGKETMAGVASWADDYRTSNPATGKWHYADTPASEAKYDRDRDCPVSDDATSKWRDCAVDRIAYFEVRLADTSLSREDRYQALKFLIHFIGDIHQPLHAIGDARGGNGIRVKFLGSDQCGDYKCNLHGVWDQSMIEHKGLSEQKYVDYLLADISEHNWEKLAGGTPVQWASASHQYAVKAFMPDGSLLTTEYVEDETRVVDSQLALGGLRLARVLNTILGHQSVPPMPVAAPAAGSERKPLPPAAPPQ